ncbi:MAG: hypothetical protein EBV84_13145, partial [Betaproteobacteria bacterium]|nr:hypothetical protein [Betaproteobacteria bacterium]
DMNRGGNNNTAILNLNQGGLLEVDQIVVGDNRGTQVLNFNGGTLKGAATGVTLISGMNQMNLFGGGMTIDTAGQNQTISDAIAGAAGKGLASIPVIDGGDGYIGPPLVEISGGGGQYATARAIVDPATGKLTSIEVTSPGLNYTNAPTITLTGGGATRVAQLGTAVLTDNVSGGLTKKGAGTLTLSGKNSYTGGTVVEAGTLTLSGGANSMANVTGNNILVRTNATLTFGGGDTFGNHLINPLFAITAEQGATISNNGGHFNTLGDVTLRGATLSSSGRGDFAWALKGLVTADGAVTSTISGQLIGLGAGSVTGTVFNVLDGAAANDLNVTAVLDNGAGPSYPTRQASSLTKNGAGTMTLTAANTYTGGTTVNAGTLVLQGPPPWAGILPGSPRSTWIIRWSSPLTPEPSISGT